MKRARKKTHSKTRSEHVAALEWNIRDAGEALQNASAMQDWAGVKKYAGQLERLHRQLFLAQAGPRSVKRRRRSVWEHGGYGAVAGSTYGRGRLP